MSCQKLLKGKNVVFLPGWGFSASIWHDIGVSLTPNCYFLNFPEVSEKTCGISGILQQLITQIPDHSILIGWSLGGLLAINLCTTFPDKFAKLILVASTPKFIVANQWPGVPLREANHFMNTAKKDIQKALATHSNLTICPFSKLALERHLNKNLSPKSLLFYLELLMNADYRDIYLSLTLPILHLFGSKDAIISAHTMAALQLSSSHITFKNLPEAGHIPFITNRKVTQKIIKKFIFA
jgi:pimeloyl-[acyl-carrier protein] methyl ester esterase